MHDWLQRDLVKRFDYTANERLPQYATEALLRERASELPSVQTLYGWDAAAIVQDSDVVTATVAQRVGSGKRGDERVEKRDARAGHPLAPAVLGSGINVFKVLGTGFTLLALDADHESVEAFQDAANGLNLGLAVVEHRAEGDAARYGATLVLVRPDQFVAWTGRDAPVNLHEARQVLNLATGSATLSSAAAH